MAGKTFTGIGLDDLLKEKPPLPPQAAADAVPVNPGEGEDAHSVNSEPTIVDAGKVAEGLQRLRSLQTIQGMPAAPPAAVEDAPPELVADMGSSEPTKIGMPAARPTAVGRTSDLEPPGKQMVVQSDLRGTMFGHSVHLPELHEPGDGQDTPSGPIYTPPPQPGAPTAQLVPYQPPPPPKLPSFHGVEPYPRQAFRRAGVSSGAYPSDDLDLRTETIPPLGRRGYARAILVMFALALAALGTLGWMRYRAGDAEDVRVATPTVPPPASEVPPASAPAGATQVAAPAAPPATEPAVGRGSAAGTPAAAPGVAGAVDVGVAVAPAPSVGSGAPGAVAAPGSHPPAAATGLPLPGDTARPRRLGDTGREPERASADAAGGDVRRRPGRSDRRRAPAAEAPPDEGTGTSGKGKGGRKGASPEEDPDATLPLSAPE